MLRERFAVELVGRIEDTKFDQMLSFIIFKNHQKAKFARISQP